MNRNYIIILTVLLLFPGWALAQRNRPQLLVYGYGADAYAAALQSSMSNVQTVWVINGEKLVPELTSDMISVTSNTDLDAGVWADLLGATLRHDKRNDSVSAIAKRRINPRIVQNVMDSVLNAAKNLVIIEGGQLRSVKKSGKYWQVELADRSRFKVRALVDASTDAYLYRLAKGEADTASVRTPVPDTYFQAVPYDGLARTGVAVGDLGAGPFTLPLASMIPADDSNLFVTRKLPVLQYLLRGTPDDIPLLMHAGQAVGATAAYAAFFKTTSDKLDVRTIQGELLQYGARLIPFADVPIQHPHFDVAQRIGATGILLGKPVEGGGLHFDWDAAVTAAEIKPVLNQLFSRSQIWFVNHASVDTLMLPDLFSYLKFVGQRGNELEEYVKKNWKRRFQFEGEYDEKQVVTRRIFAVLLDVYCQPFAVKVGLDGTIQR